MVANIDKALKLVNTLLGSGKLLRAKKVLLENLQAYPQNTKLTELLASIYDVEGDSDSALELLRGVSNNPDFSLVSYCDLGLLLLKKEIFDEALHCFENAIEKFKDSFEAHFYFAIALAAKKEYQRAAEQFMVARELNPFSSEVHYNLGRAYDAMDRFFEACSCYKVAIDLDPSFIKARVNLGLALHQLEKFQDALDSYKAALEIDTNFHDAWLNMGVTLDEINQTEDALIAYDQALKINPNSEIAHWNRAQIDLREGNFERGWDGYEYRAYGLHSNFEKYPTIAKTKNINDLIGKKILVWHEQGYGDTIQFSRFIKKLSNLNCQITLLVPPILLGIMSTLGGCKVRTEINERDSFDFQLPLMSLPKLLSIDPNACEMITPYLNVEPMHVAQWANKLNIDKSQINIGLAISGSALHTKNTKRTIQLSDIETILPMGRFYLLQKELNEVDKAYLNTRSEIVFCGELVENFQDTAAILKSMDIVISVDTSLAHLSGALNIKTLVLLPWVAEWRWQEKKDSTAWYQNTILCRQDAAGDWGSAVKKAELSISKVALRR